MRYDGAYSFLFFPEMSIISYCFLAIMLLEHYLILRAMGAAVLYAPIGRQTLGECWHFLTVSHPHV